MTRRMIMKKVKTWIALSTCAVAALSLVPSARADLLQNGTENEIGDPPLALDGTWVIIDEIMSEGDFFGGGTGTTFTWTSALPVLFTITDLFVVTDVFEVYDSGAFVFGTPALDDWDDLGLSDPFDSPPWTTDPDTALADGRFSAGSWLFGPGSHSITIKDIHIPPTSVFGPVFSDGTVGFNAEAIPAPGAVLLGAIGLAGVGWLRRRFA